MKGRDALRQFRVALFSRREAGITSAAGDRSMAFRAALVVFEECPNSLVLVLGELFVMTRRF